MLRTVVTALLVAALVCGASAAELRGEPVVGRVTAFDESAKTLTLETADGALRRFAFDADTAFLIRPAKGMKLRVRFERDERGRDLALRVGKADKPSRR
ncbi:MAG: hypothetical protein GY716_18600 [bacterium]|nr:hypothetical protein [bacterium]